MDAGALLARARFWVTDNVAEIPCDWVVTKRSWAEASAAPTPGIFPNIVGALLARAHFLGHQ